MLGLWAANLLGYDGDVASAEADALVEAQLNQDDDGAIAAELGAKFSQAGIKISRHRILRVMDRKMAEAAEALAHEFTDGLQTAESSAPARRATKKPPSFSSTASPGRALSLPIAPTPPGSTRR